MYKVERAIIMAAGLGNRMHPVTLTTPKPLVKVNGTRMIDTVIDGLHKNGINEIYVVVGYLKEQFVTLENRNCIMCSILFCTGTIECGTEPDPFFLW